MLPEKLDILKTMDRNQLAELLSTQVNDTMNRALKKVNKMLNKYGFAVTITMNFHEIEKE